MVHEFKLPDVGEGITEAEILKWMVSEGDGVREDDPLAEVETDKAIIEIPSPVDGRVKRLYADEGETVAVGETLVTFDTDDDGGRARNDGGVEILDSDGNAAVDVDAEGTGEEPEEDGREDGETGEEGGDRSFASPSTRRLAREVGVEIDEVEGSGENGRVVAQDVLHAAKEKQEARDEERGTNATPAARGRAREEDIDIGDVPPTGEDDGEEFVTEEDVDEFASHPGAGGKTPTMEEDEGPSPEFGQDKAPAVEPDTAEDTSMFGGGDTPVAEDDEPAPEFEGSAETETAEETSMFGDESEAETSETEERDVASSVFGDDEGATVEDDAEGETRADETEEVKAGLSEEETVEPTPEFSGYGDEDEEEGEVFGKGAEDDGGGGAVADETIPYRGVRRRTGDRLERAAEAPLVTHHDIADAEGLVDVRERLQDVIDVHLTYTPLLVKACAVVLNEHSIFNSRLDKEAEEIVVHDEINVGVATETDDGLLVPVVEKAGDKGIGDIAADLNDLVERARSRDLSPDEMEGGTFTLTNVGAIGGEGATPLVNPPQTAIVAVGEIRKRPQAVEDEVVARHTAPLSLTFDHRVADGAEAARFTNDLKRYLREPAEMLL